jgi:hypothetical protein
MGAQQFQPGTSAGHAFISSVGTHAESELRVWQPPQLAAVANISGAGGLHGLLHLHLLTCTWRAVLAHSLQAMCT